MPKNVWTGKVWDDYDYTYTAWGCGTTGWELAFGNMFLEELGAAIEEAGLKNDFRILEEKEKYGGLRFYTSGTTDKIQSIIDKYERLSERICIVCGKPDVPMINDGWLSPWCCSCWKKNWREREKYSSKPPKSDDEIEKIYNECICSEDSKMSDRIVWHRWRKDKEEIITQDVSETANKIRLHWEKRHGKNKKINIKSETD